MAFLRVHWGHNNGHSTISPFPKSEEQHGCLSRIHSIPKQAINHKKYFMDPKSQLQMAQSRGLGVCGNGNDNRMTTAASNFSECGRRLLHSDSAFNGWREISKIHPKKRIVDKDDDVAEKLDQWVRDSVAEIVSNIGEAPFLVHIYCDEKEESSSISRIRLVREKAAAESWPLIRGRWEGGRSIPNGVILVEELNSNELSVSDEEAFKNSGVDSKLYSTTKVWGVLIQGRGGANCTACYILKTCRVQSLSGFCTHFCLVRVECFVESADIQLKKLWLQT
ncbi:unnamed protein product [Ilex paraguariensis]|uniref:DUF7804 domain-containing protein n=1 Tax=Ilex paraguariensis TaxID=185542 RepID=A0ABC8T934_9AQUA